jgi:sarcosine oxidase / L-pipecolate oxidase
VTLLANQPVVEILYDTHVSSSNNASEWLGKATGIRTASGTVANADLLVVSAGAWTPFIVPPMKRLIKSSGQPVAHVQTTSVALPFDAKRLPVWAADLSSTGWYGFPAMSDGILKVRYR